jgi:hypothetical protein
MAACMSLTCLESLLDIEAEDMAIEVAQPAEPIHADGHAPNCSSDLDSTDSSPFA